MEEKFCLTCGRRMTMRRRWRRNWEEVRYCSPPCRRKLGAADTALEESILDLLRRRSRDSTICPSEAARQVGGEEWRPLMEPARQAARRLVVQGLIAFRQGGRPVDASTAKGPVRLKLLEAGRKSLD